MLNKQSQTVKKNSIDFEKIYKEIEDAVKVLESGEKSISENIELYKKTAKKIELAKKILKEAENEIVEVEKNKEENGGTE